MAFDDVLDHHRVKEALRAALDGGRMGHAYLFTGQDGVGKTLMAVEMAKGVLCQGPAPRPCDACPSCRMVAHERHPDLHIVQAAEGKRFVGIEQARELARFLSIMPVQSERRVVVLREAEYLSEEAANSLLKTLEEPAAFALLILTAARLQAVLPTIRSRCQEIRFGLLAPEYIATILSDRPDLSDEEVRLAARLANGSARRALDLLDTGGLENSGPIIERTLALPKADPFEIADDVLDWAKSGAQNLEGQRDRIRQFLHLLSCAYRDLLLARVEAPAELLFDDTNAAKLAGAAARFPIDRLLRVEEAIWDARRQIDANTAPNLVLQFLFDRIATLQQGVRMAG